MNYIDVLLIGISLSMDAFAVTITNGIVYKDMKPSKAVMMPVFFGVFQGVMPLLGYLTGNLFANIIEKISGPLAFIILAVIGGKMVKDGVFSDKEDISKSDDVLTYKSLTLQAVATSIDAFAVGVTFCALAKTMEMSVYAAFCLIAATTFILSLSAVMLGKKIGTLLEDKAQILGGVILILIGIKAVIPTIQALL